MTALLAAFDEGFDCVWPSDTRGEFNNGSVLGHSLF